MLQLIVNAKNENVGVHYLGLEVTVNNPLEMTVGNHTQYLNHDFLCIIFRVFSTSKDTKHGIYYLVGKRLQNGTQRAIKRNNIRIWYLESILSNNSPPVHNLENINITWRKLQKLMLCHHILQNIRVQWSFLRSWEININKRKCTCYSLAVPLFPPYPTLPSYTADT